MHRNFITLIVAALLAIGAQLSPATAATKAASPNGAATPVAAAPVDVNKANQAELESIKGIGAALSGRILQARASGNFKSWDDLIDRVAGVGPGSAARYSAAGLTVAGKAFERSAVQAKPATASKQNPRRPREEMAATPAAR